METDPFPHPGSLLGLQAPGDESAGCDVEDGLVISVQGVDVPHAVVSDVHIDHDPVERTEAGRPPILATAGAATALGVRLQPDADRGPVALMEVLVGDVLFVNIGPGVHPVLAAWFDRLDELQVRPLGRLLNGPLEVGQSPQRVVNLQARLVWLAGGRAVGQALDLFNDGLPGNLQPLLAVRERVAVPGRVEHRVGPIQIQSVLKVADPFLATLVGPVELDSCSLLAEKLLVLPPGGVEPFHFMFDDPGLELDLTDGFVLLIPTSPGEATQPSGVLLL